ncbi:hypothetical protein FS815_27385 [Agrobacterium vitis]|nr:hypothetical protein [Allorhizobium ampelinum]
MLMPLNKKLSLRLNSFRISDIFFAARKMIGDPQRGLALSFLFDRELSVQFFHRLHIVKQHYLISSRLISPHTTEEMLTFIRAILTIPHDREGCIVEAGSYKGSSSAKFSIAAKLVGRTLVICDSFQGLPASEEEHGMSIENRAVIFNEGDFAGSLDEVRANIARYGALDACDFVEGWYDKSLVGWNREIAAMYIDIDLAASTRTCLTYLYPWLQPGAPLFSQDGHLPLVLNVFEDMSFWQETFGEPAPHVEGIWRKKLICIVRPTTAERAG